MTSKKNLDFWLQPLIAQIPKSLISLESSQKILKTAKILPEEWLFNTLGLECPLYDTKANADFLITANTATNGFQLLYKTAKSNILDALVWKDIIQLSSLWKRKKNIDDFWLEFDINGDLPKVPSIFFSPLYNSPNEFSEILQESISPLTGCQENIKLIEQALNLTNKLPKKAQIFQIGAMRSRSMYGMRCCVNEISLNAILNYLSEINYPFSITPIKELLIFLQPLVHDITFSIDLMPDLRTKLGFECYIDHRLSEAEKKMKWTNLIDKLAHRNLIVSDKASILKNIDCVYDSENVFKTLPKSILETQHLLGDHSRSKFKQYLHHIKISYSPDQPLLAKSYLAVQHFWQ